MRGDDEHVHMHTPYACVPHVPSHITKVMEARCEAAGLVWSALSYKAAAAWLSGAAYLPHSGLTVLGAKLLPSGVGGGSVVQWGQSGPVVHVRAHQSMLCNPHAVYEVWAKMLYTQLLAPRDTLISLTDGCRFAHPIYNAGDAPLRALPVQCLLYGAFYPSARAIYDSLDPTKTIMVIDVAGKVHCQSKADWLADWLTG